MGFSSLEEAVEAVKREKIRGARWSLFKLSRAVIEDIEKGVFDCSNIQTVAALVRDANRSMAPLANLAHILERACERGKDLRSIVQEVMYHQQRSLELIKESARYLPSAPTITTFSYSSTVEAIILSVSNDKIRVIVLESRPGGEGAILAANLRDSGIESHLLPDTMMNEAVQRSDYVMIGADAVTKDGCLVNKLGTRQLAMIANLLGKPVIAVFDTLKIHPDSTCHTHVIEERSYLAPGYGPVRYPLFDITPQELVTVALTERGLIEYTPEKIQGLWSTIMEEILS